MQESEAGTLLFCAESLPHAGCSSALLVVKAVARADAHQHVARHRRHGSSALWHRLVLLGHAISRRVGAVRVVALELVAGGRAASASLHVAVRRRGGGRTVEVLGVVPRALEARHLACAVDQASVGGSSTQVGSAVRVVTRMSVDVVERDGRRLASIADTGTRELLCLSDRVLLLLLLLRIGGRRGAVAREAHVHLSGAVVHRRGRGLSRGGSRGVALVVRASPARAAAQPATKPRRVTVGRGGVGSHQRRRLGSAVGTRARKARSALSLGLALLSGGNHGRGARVVVRVVEERLNVGLKERVERVGNAVLLGELLGTRKRDPDTFEVHGADLDDDALLLVLEDAVTLAARHAAHVQELGAVDHVVVVPSGHADAASVHLEAERTLVLPQGCGDTVSAGEGQLGRVLGRRGVRGRREVSGAVEVAVGAVTVHKVGGRVAMSVGGRVRSEMVAAVSVASVLAVVHHHAVDTGVVGGAVGRRGGRGSGDVVGGAVGVTVAAGVLRVGVVAVGARAASVHGSRGVSVGGPARAVSATVDGASQSAVRVSMVTRVVVVGVVVSVALAIQGSRGRAGGAAGGGGTDRAGTDGRVGDSGSRYAGIAAGDAGRSRRVGAVATVAVAVVKGRSRRHFWSWWKCKCREKQREAERKARRELEILFFRRQKSETRGKRDLDGARIVRGAKKKQAVCERWIEAVLDVSRACPWRRCDAKKGAVIDGPVWAEPIQSRVRSSARRCEAQIRPGMRRRGKGKGRSRDDESRLRKRSSLTTRREPRRRGFFGRGKERRMGRRERDAGVCVMGCTSRGTMRYSDGREGRDGDGIGTNGGKEGGASENDTQVADCLGRVAAAIKQEDRHAALSLFASPAGAAAAAPAQVQVQVKPGKCRAKKRLTHTSPVRVQNRLKGKKKKKKKRFGQRAWRKSRGGPKIWDSQRRASDQRAAGPGPSLRPNLHQLCTALPNLHGGGTCRARQKKKKDVSSTGSAGRPTKLRVDQASAPPLRPWRCFGGKSVLSIGHANAAASMLQPASRPLAAHSHHAGRGHAASSLVRIFHSEAGWTRQQCGGLSSQPLFSFHKPGLVSVAVERLAFPPFGEPARVKGD
ncbi:hypothetical protein L1887_55634 [Cichorium endivia]|nr:hypothetical protein L1887_55634 [Cichorium endivia]